MSSVLLIDDNSAARKAIGHALARAGHAVTTARDGQEGARLFRELGPELVVVDMLMPGKEGIATILDIRAASPDARILAISGGGDGGFVADDILRIAELLGADGAIRKPFKTAELLAAVARCLGAGTGPKAA